MVALGLFITLTQFFRIFTIKKLVAINDSSSVISWSTIEINIGVRTPHALQTSVVTCHDLLTGDRSQVLVSCIPTYAPLIAAAREKLVKTRKSEPNSYGSWQNKGGSKSKATADITHGENESEEAIVMSGQEGIRMTTGWTQMVEHDDKV